MKNQLRSLMCLAAVCAVIVPAAGAAGQLEVRWNELSPLVVGHVVKIELPDGTAVSGEVAAVREDGLSMEIRKSSNSSAHPKGMASIPRASITTVEVRETHGAGGRVLGTVVGLVVGAVAGGEIVAHGTKTEAAGVPTFLAVTVAGTVAGYLVGRSVDLRGKVIRIVP
jgi:hypothetical protein